MKTKFTTASLFRFCMCTTSEELRVMVGTLTRIAKGPWFDSQLQSDRFLYVIFILFVHFPALCFSLFLIYTVYRRYKVKHILGLLVAFENLYFQNNFTIKSFRSMCLKGFTIICDSIMTALLESVDSVWSKGAYI